MPSMYASVRNNIIMLFIIYTHPTIRHVHHYRYTASIPIDRTCPLQTDACAQHWRGDFSAAHSTSEFRRVKVDFLLTVLDSPIFITVVIGLTILSYYRKHE